MKLSLSSQAEAEMIIDAALNVGPFYSPEQVMESVTIVTGKDKDQVNEAWNDLSKTGIVGQIQNYWGIDQTRKEEIQHSIEESLTRAGITIDRATELMENEIKASPGKLSSYVRLLGKVWQSEGKKHITFSDGEWRSDVGDLCEELLRDRIAFRFSSSSKKHSYRDYYLRVWPFDAEGAIRKAVLKHLNVEGLDDREWRVVYLLLISHNLALEYPALKNNVSFTDPELRELITSLKERGLIEERYQMITLMQGLKEPLAQYLKLMYYPKLKSEIISRLKQRIGQSISALWLFVTAGQIYNQPAGETKTEPVLIRTMNRSEIREFENRLTDIKDLGILHDFGDTIVLVGDIIRDIEMWLKGSIKSSFIYIPANDYYLARSVFRDIFSRCQEYVKILDPFLGEETFDVLEYIPRELRIHFLTRVKIDETEEPARLFKRIERLREERGGKFVIAFIEDKTTGDAPFHDRFVLSKNVGWQFGTSLKQVGKGKDTAVSEVSKTNKDEMLEPVFDHWWGVKTSELESQNKTRMTYEQWKNYARSVDET